METIAKTIRAPSVGNTEIEYRAQAHTASSIRSNLRVNVGEGKCGSCIPGY
jgi:hypothetical protein